MGNYGYRPEDIKKLLQEGIDVHRRFDLGRCLTTVGAKDAITNVQAVELLRRHHAADWGDLEMSDRQANDKALKTGDRLMSVYRVDDKVIWIITDAVADDGRRQCTTILLPEEY